METTKHPNWVASSFLIAALIFSLPTTYKVCERDLIGCPCRRSNPW